MSTPDYQLLKNTLKLDIALNWLLYDAKDDFYRDPIDYADLKALPNEYLSHREYRILQADALPHWLEYVPKKNSMLRDAIWLHPMHRILYLAILRHLLGRLDSKVCAEVYSYRNDEPHEPDKYPFGRRMQRWKQFNNDFREAALESNTGTVLMTDLASFFPHISCDQVCRRIRGILGQIIDDADEAVIRLLNRLLNMWSTDGYGIPQNHDPSSFFGSLYLHNVDTELVAQRYRFFRWIDDIRIVAKNREQAVRALQFLQRSLAKQRLFLAGEKIDIIDKDDPKFAKLVDVEDDQIISQAEEVIASGDCERIRKTVEKLFARLDYHAGSEGDDRKFRAFGHRLLDAGEYKQMKKHVHPKLHGFVLPRLRSHPERSDYWMKFLSTGATDEVAKAVREILVDKPTMFDWQRFYLWKLALHIPKPLPEQMLNKALEVAGSRLSETVAAQAIICAGKHGDNTQRENLFCNHFSAQRSYLVQRAVLIAIQELPNEQRQHLYRRALNINSDHRELVEYLAQLMAPYYGEKPRPERECLKVPRKIQIRVQRGVGIVRGQVVRFRLSRRDYDYE